MGWGLGQRNDQGQRKVFVHGAVVGECRAWGPRLGQHGAPAGGGRGVVVVRYLGVRRQAACSCFSSTCKAWSRAVVR